MEVEPTPLPPSPVLHQPKKPGMNRVNEHSLTVAPDLSAGLSGNFEKVGLKAAETSCSNANILAIS